MYARVISVRLQPGMLEELVAVYRDAVAPAARVMPGWVSLVVVASRDGQSARVIELWDSILDLRTSEVSGYLREQMARLAGILAGEPVIDRLEVQEFVRAVADPLAMRVVTFQLRPDTVEDVFEVYRTAIIPAIEEQIGFMGLLVAGDYATRRGLVATVWSSEAAMKAGELNGYYQEQLGRVAPFLSAFPVTESFNILYRATMVG